MISTNNLCFKYLDSDNANYVLSDINLQINKGEFVAILGHNGSGKSTLAKHFNAILTPFKGTVIVDEMDTKDADKIWDIRSKVAMVFQNPDNQIVATIVEDDVAFAAENLGYPPEEIRKRVDDSLETVGMSDFKKQAPHMLSGGQKQRIAIAGVIAISPDAIVLDEPTAMLDPTGRNEVMNALSKLNKQLNITVVLITHNMEEAVMTDRVVVMDKGRVVTDDVPYKVFENVRGLKELGLDVPQVTEFAYKLRCNNIDFPNVLGVDECVKELLKLCQ